MDKFERSYAYIERVKDDLENGHSPEEICMDLCEAIKHLHTTTRTKGTEIHASLEAEIIKNIDLILNLPEGRGKGESIWALRNCEKGWYENEG